MTPDRHAQIRDIFLEAVALHSSRRGAYLEQRCEGDVELRSEVDNLLAHHEDAASGAAQEAPAIPFGSPGTVRSSVSHAQDSDDCDEVYAPGEIVADRYRMIALLGQGGMGAVYRADDLMLKEQIAIKFLHPRFVSRPDWIERFLNEARLARMVTHSNVCRVFDIGEAQGGVYLSMEYIDGEDLASLMRRIGRLTMEKALEVARQVCTGLAAAHGAGVVHRDLKPANIMLDGRGRVRLTDFGIAVASDARRGRELRAGTPAYMAPEQISGRGVDVRSDIYALGLVLYELFSGRPAFRADTVEEYARLHDHEEPRLLSEACPEIDPGIERIVHECLRKSPDQRPQSALAVAAALPGLDVLSIALDAGQTPSPSLVADAKDAAVRLSRPRWAALAALASLVLLPFLRMNAQLPWEERNAKPPVVLAERARELLAVLRNAGVASDHAVGYCRRNDLVALLERVGVPSCEAQRLHVRDGELLFWLRQSPRTLGPQLAETLLFGNARASLVDPPGLAPGETWVVLDQIGRLRTLVAVPPASLGSNDQPVETNEDLRSADLLKAAGLPTSGSSPTAVAYGGVIGTGRCEALPAADAGDDGKMLVLCSTGEMTTLATVLDQQRDAESAPASTTSLHGGAIAFRIMFLAVTLVALPLAWRNCAAGRGDLSGAAKTGALVLALQLSACVIGGRHTLAAQSELMLLLCSLFRAIGIGAIAAMLYLAMEPLARRYWPHLLIGWTRLLRFRRSDPLIWQHVLIGLGLGSFWALLFAAERSVVNALGWTLREPYLTLNAGDRLLSSAAAVAGCSHLLTLALAQGLLLATLLSLARAAVRSPARAAILTGLALLPVLIPRGAHPATAWAAVGFGVVAVAVWAMTRYGLLAVVVAGAVAANLNAAPLGFQADAWYVGQSLFTLGLVASIAFYALLQVQRGPPALIGAAGASAA